MTQVIYIKNMVCPRCIHTVGQILQEEGIGYSTIQLGEVNLNDGLTKKDQEVLEHRLAQSGFEFLKGIKAKLVSQIKSLIVSEIHYSTDLGNLKFSVIIEDKLNRSYSYLSRLFSSVEGKTIEKYILSQKIEKVKELLIYDELTLSEIADNMGYSSVSHLSSQFKKETGMTPTQFKKQSGVRRFLDSI